MTDDLVYRMRRAVGVGAMVQCLDEGAEEIERLRSERDALRGFLAGLCVKLNDARLGHDWLEVSNAECAITEVIDAALGEKP